MVGKVDQLEGNFSQMKKDFEAMSLRLQAVEQAKGKPKWVDLTEQDAEAGMPVDGDADIFEEGSAAKKQRNAWGVPPPGAPLLQVLLMPRPLTRARLPVGLVPLPGRLQQLPQPRSSPSLLVASVGS